MRYLSHLARETRAKVTPPRQPSWLRPIGLLVKESAVETVAQLDLSPDPSPLLEFPATKVHPLRAPAALENPQPATLEPAVHKETVLKPLPSRKFLQPAERTTSSGTEPLPSLPSKLVEAQRAPANIQRRQLIFSVRHIEESAAQNTGFLEPEELLPSPPPRSLVAHPAPAHIERGESASFPAGHLETRAVRRVEPAPNLGAVRAEIARRQQELELQYQDNQIRPAAVGHATQTSPEVRERGQDGRREDVRINIGSIIVQTEPEPASNVAQAASARPPFQLRPARDVSDHWARSFLDR